LALLAIIKLSFLDRSFSASLSRVNPSLFAPQVPKEKSQPLLVLAPDDGESRGFLFVGSRLDYLLAFDGLGALRCNHLRTQGSLFPSCSFRCVHHPQPESVTEAFLALQRKLWLTNNPGGDLPDRARCSLSSLTGTSTICLNRPHRPSPIFCFSCLLPASPSLTCPPLSESWLLPNSRRHIRFQRTRSG